MDAVVDRRRGRAPGVSSGPLASYESILRMELTGQGYAISSVTQAVRLMRRLDGWMDDRGLTVTGLSLLLVEEFFVTRRQRCGDVASAQRWSPVVLRFLREQGLIAAPEPATVTVIDVLLAEFRGWLVTERGLANESVRCYGVQARKFLVEFADPLEASLACLDAATVTRFMVKQAAAGSVWSAKALVTSLRSLLRFLHVEGRIPVSLTAAVPGVAGWRLSGLPRALPVGQVEALLTAHDLATPVGLRDHAVLVVLTRLGIRGAEVAAIGLRDIDWRAGEIVVRGKGSRVERLPLPGDAGAALAAYLSNGRPSCACSTVFVTARAPYRPLTPGSVRAIMGRACWRAGLARVGAHRLRHTLATDMLRAGASLAEIGQVLRHRSELSTAIYAKVDLETLRMMARPSPGEL